jgi:hypothetical protein
MPPVTAAPGVQGRDDDASPDRRSNLPRSNVLRRPYRSHDIIRREEARCARESIASKWASFARQDSAYRQALQHWLKIASRQIMTRCNVLCRNRPILPMDRYIDNGDDSEDVRAREEHLLRP